MLTLMINFLERVVAKITELRLALGIAVIAAAMAVAAIFLRPYFSSLAGVVVAVNMGLVLLMAIIMFVTAVKARGKAGNPYKKLNFVLSCAFSVILIVSAFLSLSSIFFHWPTDFRTTVAEAAVEPRFSGDYRVEETVIIFDLRNRHFVKDGQGVESRETRMRIDRVVKQRPTNAPYQIQSGTNGLRIDPIVSPTHPSMTTEEIFSDIFPLTMKHNYTSSIPADRFSIGEPVTVEMNSVYVNAFNNEEKEWAGASLGTDTNSLTIVILFPKGKPGLQVSAMEKPMATIASEYKGVNKPVLMGDGSTVTWTITKPTKGTGYFVAFKW